MEIKVTDKSAPEKNSVADLQQPKVKVTNVTNDPAVKDVYGNSVFKPSAPSDGAMKGNDYKWRSEFSDVSGEQFPWSSLDRDPAGGENLYGGPFHMDGMYVCDSCGRNVAAEELATPSHIGHEVRLSSAKTNFDVADISRALGTDSYRIGPDADGVKANEGSFTSPTEDSPASGNTIADMVNDRTVPL